jgi:hypothetical protein
MAGFQAYGIYQNSNSDANNPATTETVGNNTALGLGLNYVWKKLNVDAAFNSSKQETITAGVFTAAALPASNSITAVANPLGTAIGIMSSYAGATYDFGILKAYAQYVNTKYTANSSSNSYVTRAAQQIGVRGNWTPKIESWASAGNGSIDAGNNAAVDTAANATQKFTGYQIGTNYILSKRTNLYGIFGYTQVSNSSIATSEGGSSYGVGVRHTF